MLTGLLFRRPRSLARRARGKANYVHAAWDMSLMHARALG